MERWPCPTIVLRVFESPSAAERLDAAERFLAAAPAGTELLVIGASREAADDVCRAIARRVGTTFGLHRFTLAQYASRTGGTRLAEQGLALCTPLGAEAVAARAAFEAQRQRRLSYLDPVVDAPGFARALAATLQELRHADVTADALRALAAPGPDLAVLLAEYERQLAAAKIADRATLLREAARGVSENPALALANLPALLVDVRIGSPVEWELVRALAAASPDVLLTLPAGDVTTRRLIDRHDAVVYEGPPAVLAVPAASPEARPAPPASLDRLTRQLFAEAAVAGELTDDAIEFFSAPGEGRECVEVARRILHEAARGVPFDEIAVVVRAPESYWGLLEHALHRAGVKAWFSRGTRRPDPGGRAFLALLACAAERLSARRFAEYLSLGQVPPRQADGSPPTDPPIWTPPREETLDAGQLSLFDLFGGDDAGEPALKSYAETVPLGTGKKRGKRGASAANTRANTSTALTATGAAQASSAGSASAVRADVAAARDAASSASRAVATTTAARAPIEPEPTPRTPHRWESLIVESSVIGGADRWERRLHGLIEELRLRMAEAKDEDADSPRVGALRRDIEQVEDLQTFALPVIRALDALPAAASWGEWLDRLDAIAPQVLRHPERVLELLAELRPMSAVGPLTLHEVRGVLTPRLATLDREPPKHRYGRVFVCTPAQLRGRAFRVVFVTGLAERIFPQKPRQDPLLLDPLRRLLDAPLDVEDDRVLAERLLLRLAVGAARERLFLSYPRLDVAQARPRVPSFYALDIMRALTGRVPHYELFERDTATQSGAWLAWPAPEDPSQAIDTFEHDLAVLRPLLAPGVDPAAVRGHAHYLLKDEPPSSVNARLRRSLLTRWARWKKGWSAYDGLLKVNDETRAALDARRQTRRPYSVSALQRYTACPYQFLLGSIYRLEAFDPPESLERLDPLTKGALFHEIQRDVLRALQASGLIPLTVSGLAAAFKTLDRTVDHVAERYHDRLAPAIERVWQDEIEALRGDLRMWLSRLVDVEGGWVPRHFELSFGLKLDDEHDPSSVADAVKLDGRFLLRGAIDLIEEQPETGALRVTDHKTGKNRTTPYLVVGGGGTLQPVIYGMAVEQIFGRPVRESRLYFATTVGGFTEHPVSLRDEAKRAGLEVLEIIDRALAAGRLPVAPREGACTYCDFLAVCGPLEEQRFKQKTKDPETVGDLLELRRLR